jgi:hypothetical protein
MPPFSRAANQSKADPGWAGQVFEPALRAQIYNAFNDMTPQKGLDERIRACILGVETN